MRHVGWVLAMVVAITLVGVADPVLDRLDAIDIQLSGLSITLGSVSSRIDDLKVNVDNVHTAFGSLSDQLAAEADEIKVQLGEGFSHTFFLLHDYGEALVQMNQGQNVVLQTIIENDGIDHDDIRLQIGIARQATWSAAEYIEGLLFTRFDAVDNRLIGLDDRLDAVEAKLDQLLECCATLGGFEGSLEEVIALLNYIIDTLPPGWDKKATH